MKNFFKSKYFEAIVLTAASALNLLFTVITYSINMLTEWGGKNFWNTGTLENFSFSDYILQFEFFSAVFIVLFIVSLILTGISVLLIFLKNNKIAFYISLTFNIVLNLVILFIHFALQLIAVGAVACLVINVIIAAAQLVYLIVRRVLNKEVKTETAEAVTIGEEKPAPETQAAAKPSKKRTLICKLVMLVCELLTTILVLITFFIPLYSTNSYPSGESYVLIDALSANVMQDVDTLKIYIPFIVLFLAFLASLIFFVSTIPFFFKSDGIFIKKSKQYIYGNVAILLVFFVLGFFMCFISNLNEESATTLSYIPLICSVVILIVFSVFQGFTGYGLNGENITNAKKPRIEALIYIILLTCITFGSLVLNMIEIHIEAGSFVNEVSLSGYELLTTYGELGGGLQALAFVIFTVLLVSGILLVFSVVSFFTKYKDYDRVIQTTAITNAFFVLLIGLSGVYLNIAQQINTENIESILNYYQVNLPIDYVYTLSSKSIYMFIASFVVLIVMLIRGQLSPEKLQNAPSSEAPATREAEHTDEPQFFAPYPPVNETAETESDFDACPAFTELDEKAEFYNGELAARQQNLFENLTLPNLVRFIVDYARECRLHLSYTVEDIATFVAGLGASRLTILQGMSGTGKTSLPKIFAEAVMGNCEIVEVESSWRDKNELLGYYNEFSKCFTPKKFTQCLYKAKLNSTVPTFIVLDEMNLSRIEYYFSDFLSLMEHEEDKREIKLLNVKLYRTENGEKKSYSALTDGHTIKIPANVWFIGTANRDESTFEISDKVYDRAQTMNFYKRAPKISSFSEPLPQKFVAYDMITALFESAKTGFSFDAESNTIIQKVEKLLIPYNISFGNRILRQMEDFVKIYCACFTNKDDAIKEAVEKILLSKVVCKLEYKIVENKDALAVEFDKIGLASCSAFIRRLNED